MKKIKIRGVVSHFFLYCVDEEAEMMIENQQQRQRQEIQWQWENNNEKQEQERQYAEMEEHFYETLDSAYFS